MLYNFPVTEKGDVSRAFLQLGLHDFDSAFYYIQQLPYSRNANKTNVFCVLEDKGGTCSTKHALLYRLSAESGNTSIRLVMGIYKMNGKNTPAVGKVLDKYALPYLPEAHNYLKMGEKYLDATKPGFTIALHKHDILHEEEIVPEQITQYKQMVHHRFLADFAQQPESGDFTVQQLWSIREECIEALQAV